MTLDPLLTQLQLKLLNHTYRAVKLRAEERRGDEREAYLKEILAQRKRSEGGGE